MGCHVLLLKSQIKKSAKHAGYFSLSRVSRRSTFFFALFIKYKQIYILFIRCIGCHVLLKIQIKKHKNAGYFRVFFS